MTTVDRYTMQPGERKERMTRIEIRRKQGLKTYFTHRSPRQATLCPVWAHTHS